jgi:hypothetical protein
MRNIFMDDSSYNFEDIVNVHLIINIIFSIVYISQGLVILEIGRYNNSVVFVTRYGCDF